MHVNVCLERATETRCTKGTSCVQYTRPGGSIYALVPPPPAFVPTTIIYLEVLWPFHDVGIPKPPSKIPQSHYVLSAYHSGTLTIAHPYMRLLFYLHPHSCDIGRREPCWCLLIHCSSYIYFQCRSQFLRLLGYISSELGMILFPLMYLVDSGYVSRVNLVFAWFSISFS